MSIVKKGKPSIFDLPVWLQPEKPSKATSIPKKASKAPAPPCMASRQAHEAIRNANLRTAEGRAIEYNKDHYYELKMPEDW